MSLPQIPVRDFRDGGLLAYAKAHVEEARHLMDTVLRGLGPVGRLGRSALPIADRVALRRLEAMQDPYRDEIVALRQIVGRPGPIAFSLSYEFGCTTRVFADGTLFRSLDWPFRGLGQLVEIVRLSGPAGAWTTATWPGVMGVLHGSAPGRFAIALNQAPERALRLGRAVSWVGSKRRFLRATGLPPPHLLRQVFETAPDYATAVDMLAETPVAAPVIYTLAGPGPGEACVIERTEIAHAVLTDAAAANHFASPVAGARRWRARGYDSHDRRAAALQAEAPPALDALTPPILNPLTRLAMEMSPAGRLCAVGYEGTRQVTAPGLADP